MAKDTTRHYVYALLDPRDHEIRYIGKCATSVAVRRNTHIQKARLGKTENPRLRWLRSMLAEGVRPIALTLAEFDDRSAAVDAEVWWIAALRDDGVPLTNETSGGDGVRDPLPETRAKLRARRRGLGFRDPEMRQRAIAALAAKRAATAQRKEGVVPK